MNDIKLNVPVVVFVGKKTINGIIKEDNDNSIVVDSDEFGVLDIPKTKVDDLIYVKDQEPIYIFVCKNALGCNGIRYIGTDCKNFPCKMLNKYKCDVNQVCDFNELPLNLRKAFLNGMSSQIPIEGYK